MIADERPQIIDIIRQAGLDGDHVESASDVFSVTALQCDAAIVSPGFAVDHPWLVHFRDQGIPVIPEFEFGTSFLSNTKVIAVTGSNGKSSLVKWIADTLNFAGKHAVPAGNYGLPVSAVALEESAPEFVVLELSSFQLEQAVAFKPDMAILLNLTPNHLDRHRDMETYARAKARLFACMDAGDKPIVHAAAWEKIQEWIPAGLSPVLFSEDPSAEYSFASGTVKHRGSKVVDLGGTWWGRMPLGLNAAAGVAVMEQAGVSPPVMQNAALAFIPLPHRLEPVAEFGGVRFINDSKASTMSALVAGLTTGNEKNT